MLEAEAALTVDAAARPVVEGNTGLHLLPSTTAKAADEAASTWRAAILMTDDCPRRSRAELSNERESLRRAMSSRTIRIYHIQTIPFPERLPPSYLSIFSRAVRPTALVHVFG